MTNQKRYTYFDYLLNVKNYFMQKNAPQKLVHTWRPMLKSQLANSSTARLVLKILMFSSF